MASYSLLEHCLDFDAVEVSGLILRTSFLPHKGNFYDGKPCFELFEYFVRTDSAAFMSQLTRSSSPRIHSF